MYDNVFPARSQAIQVEDNSPVVYVVRIVFLVDERQVLNVVLTRKQLVQQGDEQFLAGWLPENNLETDVGKRVYKMGHISFTFPHASKIRKLDEIGKFVCGEVLDFFYSKTISVLKFEVRR